MRKKILSLKLSGRPRAAIIEGPASKKPRNKKKPGICFGDSYIFITGAEPTDALSIQKKYSRMLKDTGSNIVVFGEFGLQVNTNQEGNPEYVRIGTMYPNAISIQMQTAQEKEKEHGVLYYLAFDDESAHFIAIKTKGLIKGTPCYVYRNTHLEPEYGVREIYIPIKASTYFYVPEGNGYRRETMLDSKNMEERTALERISDFICDYVQNERKGAFVCLQPYFYDPANDSMAKELATCFSVNL
ncbi:hypothetical protein HOC37_03230 [bacterium]|nr:hypothetical protein [bacterium]MBT3580974.1 hypothetical protein [bacterium]MBT4551980.1 hypothetical protein [bacterium]MBT5988803.1 hypothetical protein [bacterium]MBT7088231.1 hypothetical protein [bacterium]